MALKEKEVVEEKPVVPELAEIKEKEVEAGSSGTLIIKELPKDDWLPKTELGKKVKAGEITSIDEIFEKDLPLREAEIVDHLLQLEELTVDLKKTARVVRSGRKFSMRAAVLIGNMNGYVGFGIGKDIEKWPAVRKATRNAKLNIVKIHRGCGSWECTCGGQHSVPFLVEGKCASVRVKLIPAPKGTGLVCGKNITDVLKFAGISDVWVKTRGSTATKVNFIAATIDALSKTSKMKSNADISKKIEKMLKSE